MSKYMCEGCPGTRMHRPAPYLGDISGAEINRKIRTLEKSNDRNVRAIAIVACKKIQTAHCDGPVEVPKLGYDSEGSFLTKDTEIICGRGVAFAVQISESLRNNPASNSNTA